MTDITFFIDDTPVTAHEGEAVLPAALRAKIDIPHVCWHPQLEPGESCRTCLVEDAETGQVHTSCALIPKDGQKILLHSGKTEKMRKLNLELLFSRHTDVCPKCRDGQWCVSGEKLRKFGATGETFGPREQATKPGPERFGPSIELDCKSCVHCGKCVEACRKRAVGYLKNEGNGTDAHIATVKAPNFDCIFCGQCTIDCPSGAIREQAEIAEVEAALADPAKIVIAQPAPSVRTALHEGWDAEWTDDSVGQMYAALRELGFDKIFDVNFGADITTVVEAGELVERIEKNEHLPMFTSCCPAWVKYVELFQPDWIPNLTTARSPHMHSGAAFKTWWANRENIDPKNIVVVSIMPCTAKKFEATREEMWIDGMPSVDHVITTREMITMLRTRGINAPDLAPATPDSLAEHSGAAAIYGASGGVMESALRTGIFMLTGKNPEKVELTDVRGLEGVKRATYQVGDLELHVGIASGVQNAARLMAECKKNPDAFHYIEVMACPGGCIGGGGQPGSDDPKITEKRKATLYHIDDDSKVRCAHDNELVQQYMKWLDTQQHELKELVLETPGFTNRRT